MSMRHTAALISMGWISGLLYCFYASSPYKTVYAVVVLLAGIVCVITSKSKDISVKAKRGMAAVFLLASVLAVTYNTAYSSHTVGKLSDLNCETAVIEGIVINSDAGFASTTVISGKANEISGRYELKLGEEIECGSWIRAKAKIYSYNKIEDMAYNYPKGIYINADNAELLSCDDPEGIGLVYNKIMTYRDVIIERMVKNTSQNAGILLTAMFCGDVSKLPAEIRLNMNRCGVGHLLAISGFHVSVVAGAAAYLLSKLWINKTISIIVSEFFMAAFVVFSGMRISSIRAFIMISILMTAHIFGREYDSSAAISVCVIVMTLLNPYIVVSPSFLLSVTGAFGASSVAETVKREFVIHKKRYSSLIVAVCTSAVVLPISACFFNEISLISPIANLVFIPMSSAVLIICTVFALFGGADIMLPLIKLAGRICEIIINLSDCISSKAVYIPIRFKSIPFILICLGAAILIVFAVSGNIRRTVCAALAAYAAALALLTAGFAYDYNNVYLNITAKNGGYLCVIYKGSECIDIGCGGDLSSQLDSLRIKKGLFSLATIAQDDENSTFYRNTLRIETADQGAVCGEVQDGDYIGKCEIDFAGVSITVFGDRTIVKGNDTSITVCTGYKENAQGDCVIYVFNGSVVVRQGDDRIIHGGYFSDDIFLGRIHKE